jgi:hypothetical protein
MYSSLSLIVQLHRGLSQRRLSILASPYPLHGGSDMSSLVEPMHPHPERQHDKKPLPEHNGRFP